MDTISWEDFQKVDLRIGTIISVEEFKEAKRPAYKLTVDLGELGIKKSSAQITQIYKSENLINKQVICVCNFPKKQIANFMSEVLVTGFENSEGEIVLSTCDQKLPNGQRLI